MRINLLLGISFLLLLTDEAAFADRMCGVPDVVALSRNGRYRAEARSMHNVERDDLAMDGFVYRLFDESGPDPIWSRAQPERDTESEAREGPPLRLCVDDNGRVAAWLMYDELIVLDPARGDRVFRTNVSEHMLSALEPGDRGLSWLSPEYGHPYFLKIPPDNGTTGDCFVIRTPLRCRLILDLGSMSILSGEGIRPAIVEAAEKSEREWTVALLRTYASCPPGSWRAQLELHGAAWIAASLKVREAVAPLRTLESDPWWPTSGPRYDVLATRQVLQVALRRLGERPQGGPGMVLHPEGYSLSSEERERRRMSATCLADRAERAENVTVGMSLDDLIRTVGHPDCLVYRPALDPQVVHDADECLEYDMDGPASFTLRVRLDPQSHTVRHVERISPALWEQGTTRERDLMLRR